MPHGGFKQSGYGKDMSLYSLEEYTRIKHVVVKLGDDGALERRRLRNSAVLSVAEAAPAAARRSTRA